MRIRSNGVELFYREAGSPDGPTIVLLHGYPSSSFTFRNIVEPLAETTHVLAFDMPGFGLSEAPPEGCITFAWIARTLEQALMEMGVSSYYLYMHDWGTIVGYMMALSAPSKVLGIILQNGAAHAEGHGLSWDAAKAFWAAPTAENRASLGEWMNFEGVRNEYCGGLPESGVALLSPECWHYDWERLSRPGVIERMFALFCDVKSHFENFSAISDFHKRRQPPCLILWGRHDTFFEMEEICAYQRELNFVEAHILDGGHFLLESHHQECAALIKRFIGGSYDGANCGQSG
ncbi:alpha/beta hydrolase [Mesorhizobium sp. RMAD-H1]|uniref:alpha/beta fold hydrolase n=1 Tax=Mesorhizobium sp. RMAD-H1 TaxID=2587065 RepID=UPI001FEFF07A|nr:alpha/beta hydrolase [Mesorhizobium sp. RMAD-H1]